MTEIAPRGQNMPGPWTEQPIPALYGGDIMAEPVRQESVLRHYWRIIVRRRWTILTIVAACFALALIASMLIQRQYTATSRIQIDRETAKVIDIEGLETEEIGAGSAEFYQTQYALLKSRSLAESVVRSLGLADNYWFVADFDADEVDEVRELPREERFALATENVVESLGIAPVRGSSVIDVHFETANPALAARVANEVVDKFIQTNLSRRFEATAYARQFLQSRLNAVRTKLEESERKATEYARQQGLINIATSAGGQTSEQSLATADLAQLSAELAAARAARERAEADYRASSGGRAAERALGNDAVNELRQQRAQLTAELRKLESDFGPEYPRVVALKAQLQELNQQVRQEEGVVRSGVSQDFEERYRQALAAERGIQSRVNALKSDVLDQKQRSIQFNIIQRDVDTNRALYDALLQRFKEIGVAGGIGTNNVSVVDLALIPTEPSSPNLPLNLALGLFFGLVMGTGAALVMEQLAESMISPAEFQHKLGLPLLGTTPAVLDGGRKQGLWALPGLGALKALPGPDQEGAPSGKALLDSKSDLTEAYFSVLAAVQFSTPHGTPKTLAVTSSQAGEGKSTTALAIARALASVGSRVLIVDADMRNPSLHKALGLRPGRGTSDLLTSQAELADVVHQVEGTRLSVVTSGPIPPNPAELLASGNLEALLAKAAAGYDHVVLDCPPVLGLADAPLIARATEGTVFVVESGRTRSTQARQAIDRLHRVRAHVLGAVLTKLDSRNAGYGYGYGYDYSYGNG